MGLIEIKWWLELHLEFSEWGLCRTGKKILLRTLRRARKPNCFVHSSTDTFFGGPFVFVFDPLPICMFTKIPRKEK